MSTTLARIFLFVYFFFLRYYNEFTTLRFMSGPQDGSQKSLCVIEMEPTPERLETPIFQK